MAFFSKTALTAVLGLALAFTISCSSDSKDDDNSGGSTSGTNGGGNDIASYNPKLISTQTWMTKNLNYDVPGSKCYDLDPAKCVTYGRLYDWATAMALPSKCNSTLSTNDADCAIRTPHKGICPSGWHIPSDADWNVLMKVANPNCSDNSNCAGAGKKLKADSGWNENGSGMDDLEFAALPGGYGSSGGNFNDVGYYGYWWSASEYDASTAYRRDMYCYSETAIWSDSNKSRLFSVRCIQDSAL